jgi:hypothetical protein
MAPPFALLPRAAVVVPKRDAVIEALTVAGTHLLVADIVGGGPGSAASIPPELSAACCRAGHGGGRPIAPLGSMAWRHDGSGFWYTR